NKPLFEFYQIDAQRAGATDPGNASLHAEFWRSLSMKYRYLGRSGLLVSRICLGTMTFGNTQWGCDQDDANDIVRKFVDAGGNFIDTADGYSSGKSESMLGETLKSYNRDDLVIATKVWFPT